MNVITLDRDVPETWTIGPAVDALRRGELVVTPTDTMYAIVCDPWNIRSVTDLYTAKGMHPTKRCAVACGDLKDIGAIARAVTNDAFRFMRDHFPGPYTVLLHASRELPRQATGKRKSIGVRVPNHPVCQALIESIGPLMITSLPGWEEEPMIDPLATSKTLMTRPAVVLDQGVQRAEPSTVVDFTQDPPELIRQGLGSVDSDG